MAANFPTVAPGRPLPGIEPASEGFWKAAKEHRLAVQRCTACGKHRFPPEPGCFACGSGESEWATVSGRGTLYSWTVCHPPVLPYFADRTPLPVAVVELAEGPRMITTLVGVPLDQYAFDMAVRVDFEDVDEETTLVVFRPA